MGKSWSKPVHVNNMEPLQLQTGAKLPSIDRKFSAANKDILKLIVAVISKYNSKMERKAHPPWQDGPFLYVCNIRHSPWVCPLHSCLGIRFPLSFFSKMLQLCKLYILYCLYVCIFIVHFNIELDFSPGLQTRPLASQDLTATPFYDLSSAIC